MAMRSMPVLVTFSVSLPAPPMKRSPPIVGQRVVVGAAIQPVIPRIAGQGVSADTAREHVGSAVAYQRVSQRVAGSVDRGGSGQGQVLELAPSVQVIDDLKDLFPLDELCSHTAVSTA